jgi:rfaE bifunctional protein nucleotidyltransferase chain/domain
MTIVATNGCFDILHAGHVQYLQEAKSLGDKLVVGLNSDKSVKKLKGKARPFNNQKNREIVLSALECVDEVIIFDSINCSSFLEQVKPDIYVKGGDYKLNLSLIHI